MANDIMNGRIRLVKKTHGWKIDPSVKAAPSKKYDATITQSAPAHYNYLITDETGATLSSGTEASLMDAFVEIKAQMSTVARFAIMQPKASAFKSSVTATTPQAFTVSIATPAAKQIVFTMTSGHTSTCSITTAPTKGTMTVTSGGSFTLTATTAAAADTDTAVVKITDTTTNQSVSVTLNITYAS